MSNKNLIQTSSRPLKHIIEVLAAISKIDFRVLVCLVIYDFGGVSLENLLFSLCTTWFLTGNALNGNLVKRIHPGKRTRLVDQDRFQANMAHIRQSRPDSGLGFQVKGLVTFQAVPSSLGSGRSIPEPAQNHVQGTTDNLRPVFRLCNFASGKSPESHFARGIGATN